MDMKTKLGIKIGLTACIALATLSGCGSKSNKDFLNGMSK